MRKERIVEEFLIVKQNFPDAVLSNTYNHFLIRNLPLSDKYSPNHTPMLVNLNTYSDYVAPDIYVDRRLRLNGKRSHHLDERLTEKDMLKKGWVKFCVKVKWSPSYSLRDLLVFAIKYLEKMNE